MSPRLAVFGSLLGVDGLILLAIFVLIFGRRWPEVGRNFWRAIDPREDPMPLIGLVLIVVVLLSAFALARGIHW